MTAYHTLRFNQSSCIEKMFSEICEKRFLRKQVHVAVIQDVSVL